MATVFLNGAFVPQDDARVSAFDAGVQHGVGLFETMLGGVGGREAGAAARVFRLDDHLGRLIGSARELGLSDELRPGPLAEAVLRTVEKSGLARARVRLTITGGDLNLLARPAGPGADAEAPAARRATPRVRPTVMIVAQPATEYPAAMFERGVDVVIADLRVNPLDPLAGHKTIDYWGRLRELQTAAARQAGEALVFQVTNYLAGGCVSNAFIVKGGALFTPIARGEEGETARSGNGETPSGKGAAVPSPVLPGVTRKWAMEWAAAQGIAVHRRMAPIADVLGADEVFLTNSSWGVLPVVRVEKERIGGGGVGEVTSRVREAWLRAVAE
jgi:branched-subunit amino acid aminotransferase/4-amino-4-deoxychorismate lyase